MTRDRDDARSYLMVLLEGRWTFSPGELVVAEPIPMPEPESE